MFFRDHPKDRPAFRRPEEESSLLDYSLGLPGFVRESPFDIGRIVLRRMDYAKFLNGLQKIPREPTRAAYEEWAAATPTVKRSPSGTSYWLRANQKCAPLDKLLFRLLRMGASTKLPLRALLRGFDDRLAARVLAFLRDLGELGLVELNPPKASSGLVSGAPIPEVLPKQVQNRSQYLFGESPRSA